MILAFAHPGIVVPNLEKAIDFYNRMFGFDVISMNHGTGQARIMTRELV